MCRTKRSFSRQTTGVIFNGLNDGNVFNDGDNEYNTITFNATGCLDSSGAVLSQSVFETISTVRVVLVDGEQYAATKSHCAYDHESISRMYGFTSQ